MLLLQVLVALVVLALMKKLTNLRAIMICAVVAYGLAYFAAFGVARYFDYSTGGYSINLSDVTAVNGTIGFAVCSGVSWLVFRKKIRAGELADDPDTDHDENQG